ncbi:AfsR/SARP family transcriptional regulator [Nocardia uniformis]|uniref:AfsR/SARP family transcriptional regulator n=1 Tax=Nocardia uniformis TaxID=53432 RepID=A0A849BXP7_9NOCA|nr:BTAD domain-containing putative transcriptional regulator [Nocardia uniformis]NNH71343.1 AfsR/SARP family transcriptional regulator [Nocardia uniformis]
MSAPTIVNRRDMEECVGIGLLGPLELAVGSEPVPVGGTRLRILLTRLALDVGRVVPTEALADTVWPTAGPGDRTNALHSLISRLRQVLPGDCLRSTAGGYVLDLPSDAVDAKRFERLAAEGARQLSDGRYEDALGLLVRAQALWRGELPGTLPDFAHQRLTERRLCAMEDSAAATLAVGRPAGVAAELAPLAAAHPFRERLQALYIRALHAEGRQAEALTTFAEIRAAFADELGADPGPELRAAHLAVVRGESSARTVRGNLRAARTRFIGREPELGRLRALLDSDRLITLTGPGGVGKTRLAAAAVVGDGAWLVELAAVHGPGEVVRAATTALGIGSAGLLEPPRDPIERLAETLGGTETVLVLDNCEHVLDEATAVVDELLGRCPALRIIATSREPLGLAGERVCAVPPLPLAAAVRLFADRAAAARPGFRLDEETSALVENMCSRLDRLPLAIELAAGRVGSIPLRELNTRLEPGFGLLARPDRAAQPRHRTLRAVVEWSWDLLDCEEQAIARRLAVFHGAVDVDSAAAVTGATVDRLAALADKSLLQFDGERYLMLVTVRDFALEKLSDAAELTETQRAHATCFQELAERAEPRLRGPGQLPWLRRLDGERDNFSAALRYAHAVGDAEAAVRLCAALGTYWLIRGDRQAMMDGPRLALEIPGAAPSDARAATTALSLLAAGIWSGIDIADAAAEALAAAEHPLVALIEPCLAAARQGAESGLAVLDRRAPHPDGWTDAMLRLLRAALCGEMGDLDGQRSHVRAAIAGFRSVDDRAGLSWALTIRADLRAGAGEFDSAIHDLNEVIALSRELDPGDKAVLEQARIAELRGTMGDIGRARADLEELLASVGAASGSDYLAFAQLALAELARRDGDPNEADLRLGLAAAGFAGMPCIEPLYRVRLACARADLAMDIGDLGTVRDELAAAFEVAVTASGTSLGAVVAARLARWCALTADPTGAVELIAIAHTIHGALDARDLDLAGLTHTLRDTLGDQRYTAAYTRGRDRDTAMGAVAIALGTTERTPAPPGPPLPAPPASHLP